MCGQQCRTGLDRQLRRPHRHPGGLAEEVDLNTGAGEIALGHQADHSVVPQPLTEHLERRPFAAGQRQHLKSQAFAVVDKALVQRFGF
ncbi:Uncharacterised protein [Mycobacterium tuberculosis]|nr:Uncharacterised protein [Mycobacterium tuberculosis]